MNDRSQCPCSEIYGSVYEKNHVIFRQGDSGDQMYVIQSGAVEVCQRRGDEEVVLGILEKGDFFGEMALISRAPRSATVTTLQRSRLLPFGRGLLLDKFAQVPETALHLLKTLIQRIQRADLPGSTGSEVGAEHSSMIRERARSGPQHPAQRTAPEDTAEAGPAADISPAELAALWIPRRRRWPPER